MKTKESAARLHARLYTGEHLTNMPKFPKLSKECHSYMIQEKERAFLAGYEFCKNENK